MAEEKRPFKGGFKVNHQHPTWKQECEQLRSEATTLREALDEAEKIIEGVNSFSPAEYEAAVGLECARAEAAEKRAEEAEEERDELLERLADAEVEG